MAGAAKFKSKINKSVTTGIGTLSFPHVFKETAVDKKDDNGNSTGVKSYETQLIIPKANRKDALALLAAIKEVGEAQWGENWRKARNPLRDGDKEADELAEDGQTKGQKYPERLGCYFINARSTRPVGVVDRNRVPITESSDLYSGCLARLGVEFYAYSTKGNIGIGVGLNGVQKVGEGEPIGGSAPSVESMFDMLDDEEVGDDDLEADLDAAEEEDEPEEEAKPAKKTAAKKAPAKKAAAKKVVVVEPDEDEETSEEDDLLAELDDLDD